MIKRTLRINHNDTAIPTDLSIAKAVVVHSEKEFIYWDKLPNGEWQLTFSSSVVADFSKVDSFEIVREGD